MGTMLEALKKNEGRRTLSGNAVQAAQIVLDDCVMDWALNSEENVPFIEVGGPGRKVDGSSDVLKHSPHTIHPPHPPTEKTLISTALAELAECRPMTVAFEPWTGPTAISSGVASEIISFHQPEHAVSKQYGVMLEKMLEGKKGTAGHVLVFSGVRPNVGATTVLLNLAVSAARSHRRVIVVDGQLRKPSLAARLGFVPEIGLLDAVTGKSALEETVVKTAVAGLCLLPALPPVPPDASLTSEAASWLIGWLRERFDLVLIDGPTVDESASLASLASRSDGLFLVAPQGTPTPISRATLQSLTRGGAKLSGLLHTHLAA